ncbi:ABC transporter ATP-binding protein [Intestinibacillus sp. NTUH-41-i26]|uniref:ABC transporter ATP-binding protein n=1 Tax=Butyricicoccaceae TaxID=3085642 RepID=UPI000D1EFB91|nr:MULTISPECIES: ABC transporter ATP-binding protein [Butyricicoccaceae]WOC75429.1 ABC transporter ATP-binding protein [Intestinibacillus sp. NTUH-41-i26]
MLKIDQVTIRFGGLTAVNEVDFEVKDGAIFGLIGPNGAGKTTLFNIISGVYAPNNGKIMLEGEDITGLQPYQICCKGIARTYQNINLFHDLTVIENVKIGCHSKVKSGLLSGILHTPAQKAEEKAIEEKCLGLLDFVGLTGKRDMLARNLSYGDQRRVEIARAMATEPKLLLLDEPAAGMNSKEKVDLTALISKINARGMTILLVEHDMKLVMKVTDEIAVLNFGKKLAQGTPEEIQANPAVIEAYLGGGIIGD